MKRVLTAVLALIMIFSLVGCGGTLKDDPSTNPSVETPSKSTPDTPSSVEPDVIIPEYTDDDVIVHIDGEDVVFIGNAAMEWQIDDYDDGVMVTQNEETIVITPTTDTQTTTTIVCPDVVMYFVSVTKEPAQRPTVFVERFELDPDDGMGGEESWYPDLDEIIEYIYANVSEEVFQISVMSIPLEAEDREMCSFMLGVNELEGMEYAMVSSPAISSIAYSLAVIKFDSNANAEAATTILKDNAPTNKWICVSAEAVSTRVVKDNYVICVMGTQEMVQEVDNVTFE